MQTTMSTPWGTAQSAEELAPGVFFISTASHGGLQVFPNAENYPEAARIARSSTYSFMRGTVAWLEEDCDAGRYLRTLDQAEEAGQ